MRGRELLEALYAGLNGTLELRAIRPSGGIVARGFLDPTDHKGIAAFIRHHADVHVYFGVALRRDETSGTLANCVWLPALFADLDFCLYTGGEVDARAALARCPLAPTAVVHSGGGLHCYWRLKEPIDLTIETEADTAKSLLRRLAAYLGGDLKSAEPAHVLRVPNTTNYKYAEPRRVTLESLT